jgi:hypothetical protein
LVWYLRRPVEGQTAQTALFASCQLITSEMQNKTHCSFLLLFSPLPSLPLLGDLFILIN